jgi:hypothetical protein
LSETPKKSPSLHSSASKALRFHMRIPNQNTVIGASTVTLFFTPKQGTFMPRIIEVIVSPQGEVTLQTKGYAGRDCLQASKFLEQALGVVTNDQKTTEFYQTETARQQLRQ